MVLSELLLDALGVPDKLHVCVPPHQDPQPATAAGSSVRALLAPSKHRSIFLGSVSLLKEFAVLL